MKGVFELEDEVITFRYLSFGVPGAAVDLTGVRRQPKFGLDCGKTDEAEPGTALNGQARR
jgi:hypothetical protein